MNTELGKIIDKMDKSKELEERKARLLREGEFYRVGIARAKAQIQHGARPDTMLHAAIGHAGWALRSRIDGLLKPTGVNLAALMPYALSVLGFVRRRRLGKPALAVSLALGALGWYLQRRRTNLAA